VRIDVSNRVFALIVFLVVVMGIGAVVYAYGGSDPMIQGHDGNELMVNVGGVDKTLQQAIDDGDFGGGGSFGGIYTNGSSHVCVGVNPMTGSCTCPTGFTESLIASGVNGVEQYFTLCTN